MEGYKSAAFHFREFLESSIWHDLISEMDAMRDSVRDSLETCEEEKEIFRFQGRAEVLRDLRLLPSAILANIENDQRQEAGQEAGFNDLIDED